MGIAEQTIFDARLTVQRASVVALDDAGDRQRATVETQAGFLHADVEVMQPAGFAGVPVIDGAEVLLLAIGGDPANLVALPLANPAWRYGGLAVGETVLYGPAGERVAIRQGGTIEISAATAIAITAPSVTITGNLVVTGDISDANGAHGTLANLRDDYNAHHHGGSGPTDHPTD